MDSRPRLAIGLGFALCLAASGRAQSTRPADLAQGKILVTPRHSPDPHFAKSVIVLAHYDRSGALGLMLQYRSDISVARALKDTPGAGNRTENVFIGGPVQIPVVVALSRSKSGPAAGATSVIEDLYLMMSKQSIAAALSEKRPASDLRIFLGYAGWAAGQLENEVTRAGWFIFNYDESIVFDDHPETLWDRMIERTERKVASAATQERHK